MRSDALFQLIIVTLLGGCAYQDAHLAQVAQRSLIGASKAELDMCAGLPTKSERIDADTEMRSYERAADTNSGINLSFPVIGGGLNVGNAGYCHATFKLVDDRVAELRYAGETSKIGAEDAVCGPIVASCVRHPEVQPSPAEETSASAR
jgi:hypothetical protein